MGKKVNPRRRPVNAADVARAKKDAMDQAVVLCWAVLLSTLRDKGGYSNAQLARLWQQCEKLSEEIQEGRVKVADLIRTLKEEAGIELED